MPNYNCRWVRVRVLRRDRSLTRTALQAVSEAIFSSGSGFPRQERTSQSNPFHPTWFGAALPVFLPDEGSVRCLAQVDGVVNSGAKQSRVHLAVDVAYAMRVHTSKAGPWSFPLRHDTRGFHSGTLITCRGAALPDEGLVACALRRPALFSWLVQVIDQQKDQIIVGVFYTSLSESCEFGGLSSALCSFSEVLRSTL